MQNNNIKASIFIYILLLINITFIIAITVYNNWSILSDSINVWKNSEEVFTGIYSNWDIAINSVRKYNSNWNGYIDWISCPTNVLMEWSWSSSSGLVTQMVYSSWSIYCQWFYNSDEFRLFYNDDYSAINKAYYLWNVVDIIFELATTLNISPTNTAPGTTISWTPNDDEDWWFDPLIDLDVDKNDYDSKASLTPYLKFTFLDDRWVWLIKIYNDPGTGNWNNWKIKWLSSTWSKVYETTIVSVNSNEYIQINLKLLWLTDDVRAIRIEATDWNQMELNEIEIYEMTSTSASRNIALASNWTTATWTVDEDSNPLSIVIDWNKWSPRYDNQQPEANPFLLFTFSQDYSLWSVKIYKKDDSDDWDDWDLELLNSSDSIIYSIPLDNISEESLVEFDLLALGHTGAVRKLRVDSENWKQLRVYEIEAYELEPSWWWESWRWETPFDDTDQTWITFDYTGMGWNDDVDDDFNSDNYRVTSIWDIYYPGGYQDDDVMPRKVIFWNVPVWSVFQNIFWNNYKTNAFVEKNPNNDDILNVKIWDVVDWNMYLDLYDTSENNFDLKVLEFDRDSYEIENTLLPIEKYESFDLTEYTWYIQNNSWALSLSKNKTWNEYIFDYKNKDYWIFISNNSNWNLTYRLSWETTSWTGIYINPIDDSWTWVIDVMSNYLIIGLEKNFIWENFIVTWLK